MGIEQALRDCNDNRVILSGQLSALRRQNDELRQQNVAMAAQLRAIPLGALRRLVEYGECPLSAGEAGYSVAEYLDDYEAARAWLETEMNQ